MDQLIPNLLNIVNVGLGLYVFYAGLKYCKVAGDQPWRWIKISKSILGLYWAFLYTVVILASYTQIELNSITFGRNWVRPAITITLAIMAAATEIGAKRYQSEHQPNDNISIPD